MLDIGLAGQDVIDQETRDYSAQSAENTSLPSLHSSHIGQKEVVRRKQKLIVLQRYLNTTYTEVLCYIGFLVLSQRR